MCMCVCVLDQMYKDIDMYISSRMRTFITIFLNSLGGGGGSSPKPSGWVGTGYPGKNCSKNPVV